MSAAANRRFILAGMALAPVAALPAVAATETAGWNEVVAVFRACCKERSRTGDIWTRAQEAYFASRNDQALNDKSERAGEVHEQACNRLNRAYEAVINYPVRNMREFLSKLDIFEEEEDHTDPVLMWILATVREDVARLNGGAA